MKIKNQKCVINGVIAGLTRNPLKKMLKQVQHDGGFLLVLVAIPLILVSSCNFLNVDDYFNESLKVDSIFANKLNFERYLWATVAQFPDEGNEMRNAFSCDEAFTQQGYEEMNYVLGHITPDNIGSLARWDAMYIVIRKANTMLANIDTPHDMTEKDKREMLGFIYFMRAYAYYRLFMQYGPLVIVGDDVMLTNEEPEYYDRARETFDATVDYICDELEKAAAHLPTPEQIPISFFGRPSSHAALGLIARLRLIQASPLWNGGESAHRTFGQWRRSTDGVHYVSQVVDEEKWAVAAMACKRIIDFNRYRLFTVDKQEDTYPSVQPLPSNVSHDDFPNGAGNIDPYRSYAHMFNGESQSMSNPEYLWGRRSGGLTSFTAQSFPSRTFSGGNSISIPQKIIDSYLMVDGRAIEDAIDGEYVYETTGTMGGSDRFFSEYRLMSTVNRMYVNREMRFYASIGFNQGYWPMTSSSVAERREQVFTYYAGGNAGSTSTTTDPERYCITGYTLKKYIHDEDSWGIPGNSWADGSRRMDKSFPIIRYAEILLSYAEALNNLTPGTVYNLQDADGKSYTISRDMRSETNQSLANVTDMEYYFNMVRYRAGLPGLTTAEAASQETMQALIEREWLVEFLFEGRRFYDVRRWGKYELTEYEPMTGMNTDAAASGYYTIVPINHPKARNRVVDRRLILYPIRLAEIRKSSKLDQNPGWAD